MHETPSFLLRASPRRLRAASFHAARRLVLRHESNIPCSCYRRDGHSPLPFAPRLTAGEGICSPGREKQEVFLAASMDGFTAARRAYSLARRLTAFVSASPISSPRCISPGCETHFPREFPEIRAKTGIYDTGRGGRCISPRKQHFHDHIQ